LQGIRTWWLLGLITWTWVWSWWQFWCKFWKLRILLWNILTCWENLVESCNFDIPGCIACRVCCSCCCLSYSNIWSDIDYWKLSWVISNPNLIVKGIIRSEPIRGGLRNPIGCETDSRDLGEIFIGEYLVDGGLVGALPVQDWNSHLSFIHKSTTRWGNAYCTILGGSWSCKSKYLRSWNELSTVSISGSDIDPVSPAKRKSVFNNSKEWISCSIGLWGK